MAHGCCSPLLNGEDTVFLSVLEQGSAEREEGKEEERRRQGLGEGATSATNPFVTPLHARRLHTRARTPREPRRVAGNTACTLSFKGFLPSDVNAPRSAGSHAVPPLHESSSVGVTCVASTFRVVPVPSSTSHFAMLSKWTGLKQRTKKRRNESARDLPTNLTCINHLYKLHTHTHTHV